MPNFEDAVRMFSKLQKRNPLLFGQMDKDKFFRQLSNIEFARQGNFTIVTLLNNNGHPSVGVAKRSPMDADDLLIGTNVALRRAVAEFYLNNV